MFNPLDEQDGWKLLEERSINDRTLVAWYNPDDSIISFAIMHLTEQPNALSLRSSYTTWGYITHMESMMYTTSEAAEVVSLYLQDMENENYWWENV